MGIIFVSLIFSILLESSLTTLPLTLIIILFSAVVIRKNEIFLLAFLAGLFLDFLTLETLGLSSLYFVSMVYVVFLYQKKFEIETLYFVTTFSFLGVFGYLFIERASYVLLQSLAVTVLVFFSYISFKKFNKKIPKYA